MNSIPGRLAMHEPAYGYARRDLLGVETFKRHLEDG